MKTKKGRSELNFLLDNLCRSRDFPLSKTHQAYYFCRIQNGMSQSSFWRHDLVVFTMSGLYLKTEKY